MNSFYDFLEQDRILYKGEHFFIYKDKFPVSPGHLLIISNKLRLDYFSLNKEEISAIDTMILLATELIEQEYKPDGYNIGMNCKEAAGQSVMHFHMHIWPRYKGDVEDPRGGIRNCMPNGNYLKN